MLHIGYRNAIIDSLALLPRKRRLELLSSDEFQHQLDILDPDMPLLRTNEDVALAQARAVEMMLEANRHRADDVVNLRTQRVQDVNGGLYTLYYTHWDDLLACEGSQNVTLTQGEADALNEGKSFMR